MNVEEVMSKELIVGYVPGTIRDVLKILAKHNVSGMPVLKKDTKKVVGVITRNDIFKNPDEEQLALIMSTSPDSSSSLIMSVRFMASAWDSPL